jgi:GNAT superfamily N-acetyltransferase
MTWELRAMREEDRALVMRSWLDSYWDLAKRRRYRDKATGEIDPGGEFQGARRSAYYELYAPLVDQLMARCEVFVATMPDVRETDIVFGWIATEVDPVAQLVAVHYVHVKPRFRKTGLGRWLVAQMPADVPVIYTHEPTPVVGRRLVPPSWSFDSMRRFGRKAA